MRCSCHVCDTYMTHSEGLELGCVCPECGYRCKACLGTNTVLSREALKNLAFDPRFSNEMIAQHFEQAEEEAAQYERLGEKYEKDEYVD